MVGRHGDADLAARGREVLDDDTLSSFVARAVEHELTRTALDRHLTELDEEFGAPPRELVEHFDELWPT